MIEPDKKKSQQNDTEQFPESFLPIYVAVYQKLQFYQHLQTLNKYKTTKISKNGVEEGAKA